MKPLFSSKRFWAGLLSLITGVSLIFTGEKTFSTALPEIIMTAFGLIQTIIAITSGTELTIGGKSLAGRK